jgi:hypothetical protein
MTYGPSICDRKWPFDARPRLIDAALSSPSENLSNALVELRPGEWL